MPTVLALGKSSFTMAAWPSSGARSEVPEMFLPVVPFQSLMLRAEA
jgi:hypothetical protein